MNLRGSVFFYDAKGKLIKECLLGERFFIDKNSSNEFYDFITSTGLQIKIDPGIKTVYFSFFLLMISTYVSFISYSQIWGVEEKGLLGLAGKSNRAVLYFQEEFRKIQVRVKN